MTCTLRTPSWLIYNSQSVGKLTRTVWWQQPFYRTHSYQKDIALETLVLKNHVSEFCVNILKLSLSFLCLFINNLLLFFSFCIISHVISILFSCSWIKADITVKNLTQRANFINHIQFSAFSLTSYVASHGLDLNHLSEIDLAYLYDKLGISTYLSSTTCNRSSEHYQPATDGWKNGEP